jgi:hypothetical protein
VDLGDLEVGVDLGLDLNEFTGRPQAFQELLEVVRGVDGRSRGQGRTWYVRRRPPPRLRGARNAPL